MKNRYNKIIEIFQIIRNIRLIEIMTELQKKKAFTNEYQIYYNKIYNKIYEKFLKNQFYRLKQI